MKNTKSPLEVARDAEQAWRGLSAKLRGDKSLYQAIVEALFKERMLTMLPQGNTDRDKLRAVAFHHGYRWFAEDFPEALDMWENYLKISGNSVCEVYECYMCGMLACPSSSETHLWHDGCGAPSCSTPKETH